MTIAQAFDLAVGQHRDGKLQEAEALYRRIIALDPGRADCLNLLAQLLAQTGRADEAISLLSRATAIDPNVAEYHVNLGVTLAGRGIFTQAISALQRAVSLRPQLVEARYNLANAFKASGQFEQAICEYRQTLALRADFAPAWNNLGNLLADQKQFDHAVAALRNGIALRPNNAEAHYNLANALKAQEHLDDAVAEYRVAIKLRPDYAMAYNNLGSALQGLGQLSEAMSSWRRAIELNPNLAEAHGNLGNALKEAERLPEAIAAYREAIVCRSDDPHLQWNLALALLLDGQYAKGWPLYESRFKTSDYAQSPMNFPQPRWDGSELKGRRILLCFEQGFGDMIQFVRFAPLVAQRGGHVIALGPPELKRLLDGECGIEQFAVPNEALPLFDCYCPLLTLPLRLETTVQNIPADVPYLAADRMLTERWRGRVAALGGSLKIGIAWAGNPKYVHDRRRSLPLSALAPLAQVPDVAWISLQKGPASAQLASVPEGLQITDWTAELTDFADTAALIANLDLVIACDTSVAHLAGALSRPAWVLIPRHPDWRWMLDRSDSPWYPTLRLYRQPTPGDWSTPIRQITDALTHHRTSL